MDEKKLWQVRLIGNIQVFVYGWAKTAEEVRDLALSGGVAIHVVTVGPQSNDVEWEKAARGEIDFENAYAREMKDGKIPSSQS
jgi:hypothetical protein